MNTFADRLKQERKDNGFTQKKMAELLGMSFGGYQNYERKGKGNREPNYDTLVKIAKILNTSIDYLLGKDD